MNINSTLDIIMLIVVLILINMNVGILIFRMVNEPLRKWIFSAPSVIIILAIAGLWFVTLPTFLYLQRRKR